MSFATMSPADRIKASGLIGLIVVIVFFVVHTVLGSVSPKKPDAAASNGTAAPGVPGPPAPTAGPDTGAPGSSGPLQASEAFPTEKAMTSSLREIASERDVPDPFVQLRDPNARPAPPRGAPAREPDVHVGGPLPTFRGYGAMASAKGQDVPFLSSQGAAGQAASSPMAVLAPPPPEPEIKVVGLVDGETPVATIEVDGKVVTARPGDALAKGYRLLEVHSEGVTIRHDKEQITLRVGAALSALRPENKAR